MKQKRTLRHFLVYVTYDGLLFGGWQIQEGRRLRTVQGEFEKALKRVFHKKIRATAAGRTDKGVHACMQGVSFTASGSIPVRSLSKALNAALPEDIRVTDCFEVKEGFNARFNCSRKHYRYKILNSPGRDVFARHYAWFVPDILDLEAMQKAAGRLVGTQDFSAFTNESGSYEHCIREVFSCVVRRRARYVYIDIEATGFLRKMVRNIAGFLVDVGKKRRSSNDVVRVLKSRDRALLGMPAPACGLYLWKVAYDRKFFLVHK